MSQILQPVFGSHVLQCNVLLSASVKGVSKVKLFSLIPINAENQAVT